MFAELGKLDKFKNWVWNKKKVRCGAEDMFRIGKLWLH